MESALLSTVKPIAILRAYQSNQTGWSGQTPGAGFLRFPETGQVYSGNQIMFYSDLQ